MLMEVKNLNDSIISIRVSLQNLKLKKSGKNKFAGFEYYELADFLPALNELMQKENINDQFTIENEMAILILRKGEESQEYKMPFKIFDTPLNKDGKPSMQDIQYLGALNTYYKRYLYLNAFGITDGEIIDSMDTNDLKEVDKVNYRQLLIDYCNSKNIDMTEVAKKNKLNAKSSQTAFKKVLESLGAEECKM
ncbi:MAG: hypothetical protein E7171_00275 [Firmicutes bacterium]|nr:hypothetical protein [Bacillota bacterium]